MKTVHMLRSLAVGLIAVGQNWLAADPVQLVSARNPAVVPPASANGDSGLPILSPDGRLVLFASSAEDLLVMTNGARMTPFFPPRLNVFLRDRTNASSTLVSINLTGTGGGNGDSLPAGLSTNGRYALMESSASDLVANDTNNVADVFVRDLVAGTTVAVSVSANGDLGNGASRSAMITPDGRYVAFVSAASNLVAADTNGIADVFLRDLEAGTTTLVSVGAKTANRSSEAPEVTPDGRYVTFYSTATNLVSGGTNVGDIYVRDVVAGTTVWASAYARTALQLSQNAANGVSFGHSISADGQFVVYEASPFTASASLPAPPTTRPGAGVILRYHTGSGLTDLISTNAAVPSSGTEDARNPVMTPEGRFVAFVANANGATTSNTCILVWDAQTGGSVLASGDLTGLVPTNSICDWPTITPEGRFVTFLSTATNLVTNALAGEFHLYRRDQQAGTTCLLNVDTNGLGLEVGPMSLGRLTADGGLGAFESPDGRLVSGDENRASDVFARDLMWEVTELVSARHPTLVSVTPNGPSTLSPMSVNGDGRYVAFVSEANDLVPCDTNGVRDVFVRDLTGGTNVLVSADTNGVAPGNGDSFEPCLSADGRYVAFTSTADNLAPGDRNKRSDVFVRDLLTGTTRLASVNLSGWSGNRESYSPTFSATGQAILFHSRATDLVPGASNYVDNVFWRDLALNTTYVVFVNSVPSSTSVAPAAMTPDGRYVAVGRLSSSLWYVWDSQLHALVAWSSYPGGTARADLAISPDGNRIATSSGSILGVVDLVTGSMMNLGEVSYGASGTPRFSADSRFLVYRTTSAQVIADANWFYDIYLYDFQTSSNYLVSCAVSESANRASDSPALSPDGRFVAYRSAATNLVPNDVNGFGDVFVWDRLTGATRLLSASRATNTAANSFSSLPVFSGDGQTVAFQSCAADLVAGDCNGTSDVFAYRLVSSDSVPAFQAIVQPGTAPAQGTWITWPVVPGKSYRVQFKHDLAEPSWQDFSGGVTLVGSQGWFGDATPGVPQRFYRIVAQ